MTDQEEYNPGPKRTKLIDVMSNPDNRYKSVTEICKLADIARETYYEAFKDERFVSLYKDTAKQLVDASVIPVINAFIKAGRAGSFQHGKVILEMAEMHTDKLTTDHKGAVIVDGPVQLVTVPKNEADNV